MLLLVMFGINVLNWFIIIHMLLICNICCLFIIIMSIMVGLLKCHDMYQTLILFITIGIDYRYCKLTFKRI